MNFSRKAAIFFFFFFFLKLHVGNSLTVQWLGLGTFTAMTWVQFLAGKLRSHKLHGQKKKKKKLKKATCQNGIFSIQSRSAAAAKSLQSCLTLCDPIDGSPPGSAVPGILQARTLEWVAISFSNSQGLEEV